MALDTISDYVQQARILTQDTVQPYRYPDPDFIQAFEMGALESKRLRPDLWLYNSLPSFEFAQTSFAQSPGGISLNFSSLSSDIQPGWSISSITNSASLPVGVTVGFINPGPVIVLSGGTVAAQVQTGDWFAFVSAQPVIDPMYRMAFVYYMVGQAQLRDEEETQDTRAMMMLQMFEKRLVGLA